MTKDGIIAIDKPEGVSSAAVVARVKKKLGVKKVGHTGTLDPFATGLMLCGVNKGTRLSQFFLGGPKSYIAEVALGVETDTQDFTGHIIKKCNPEVLSAFSYETILRTTEQFRGIQMQHPPVYSALKHNGKRLYQLARQGQPLQKPPRRIEIYSIEVRDIKKISESEGLDSIAISNSEFSNRVSVTLAIHCSSGTYIRAIAHDIGELLGCGACLSSLRRTETHGFSIDHAIALNELEEMVQEDAFDRIIPMSLTLPFMPVVYADNNLMDKIRFGRPLLSSDLLHISDSLPPSDSDICQDSGQITDHSETAELFKLSDLSKTLYMRVIASSGELAAIIQYDRDLDKYDYCCVFAN